MIEHRQELWDQLLVEAWIADASMRSVIANYRESVNCPRERGDNDMNFFAPLKRAPRLIQEVFFYARVYVALALPTTNRWLWAGARGDRIMKIISKESRVLARVCAKQQLTHKPYAETRLAGRHFAATTIGAALLHHGHRAGDGRVKS